MSVICTAGHVDHGKSALVKALTGTDPDRFAEERRRGMTIDLGFAPLDLGDGMVLGIVDVPGHEHFIGNMLAGAGAVRACLFVVDAGEGWRRQSEEHLRILDLLGMEGGVIALTKCDAHDEAWIELQRAEVATRVAGTFLDDAPILAVSAVAGTGLDELRGALADLARALPAADSGRPRLWIDRVFVARGAGTVITGTLAGGSVRVGEQLDVRPGTIRSRVRGLQSHGRPVDEAGPGSRVAINLQGADSAALARGQAVVRAEQWRPTARFDASLDVLAALTHPVTRRGAYTVHVGSAESAARLRILHGESIEPGQRGLVRVRLDAELPLRVGDRFVVREWGRDETVGGGIVLDVAPRLAAAKARPTGTAEGLVAERGAVRAEELAAWTGERVAATDEGWVIDPAHRARVTTELLAALRTAGAAGIDPGALDEVERVIANTLGEVRTVEGRLVLAELAADQTEDPLVARLRAEGLTPEPPDAPRERLRPLIQRGVLVERDGICWHRAAIATAARAAHSLTEQLPGGFTVAQFRDALGVTRKFAVPLLAELDARGATRRRGDLRVVGPRLGIEVRDRD